MASSVSTPSKSRVNGWDECRVNDRSLAALRSEMLRSKKSEAADISQSPRSANAEPLADVTRLPKEQTSQHPSEQPLQGAKLEKTENETPTTSAKRADSHGEQYRADELQQSRETPPARTTQQPEHSPEKHQPPHVSNQKAKPQVTQSTEGNGNVPDPPILPPDVPPGQSAVEAPSSTPINNSQPQPETADAKGQESETDKPDSSPDNHAPAAKDVEMTDVAEGSQPADANRSPAVLSEPVTKEPSSAGSPGEAQLQSNQTDPQQSKSSESEGSGRSPTKETEQGSTKKRMRSPAKQDARKRKKKNRSDSPPSGTITPNRTSEKKSKESKTADLASAVDVDMVELDPEAREAAAIAAQAEKEEASSRARRTTRLAAGKIKQVDYKASANPQSVRSLSPGQDNEDADGQYHVNDTVEPAKSSRRRTTQNHSGHHGRPSRRVTRQRGSYERETSSNDEVDNSGWRSGGNSNDKKNGSNDDVDEVVGSSRVNGIRNDRKRSRADSRRGRNNHSSDMDRGNNGSRDSPDKGSPDLPDEDDDFNEEETIDDDEDPEMRTDAYGFNIQDLTCVGLAIKNAGSVDPSEVLDVLQDQNDWQHEDQKNKAVTSYVERIRSAILNLRRLVSLNDDEVTVPQALAFVATDIFRLRNGALSTGYARKPTAIFARAQKEESQRVIHERSRRKEQRDADEARNALEKEMEARRKLEVETLYAKVQLSELRGRVKMEEVRCTNLENEISRYAKLEADVRARFDRAKLVLEKLHSDRRSLDNSSTAKEEQDENAGDGRAGDTNGNSPKRRRRSGSSEKRSSNGVPEAMDEESLAQSEKAREMARLQALIAERQAEIEDYQRRCVEARMTYAGISDVKSRLETELHVHQSVAQPNSGTESHPAPTTHYMRSHKESGRKNEGKSGGGGRNTGNTRGRSHGKGSSGGTPSRQNGSNKGRSGNGRHGENGKGTKRKVSNKHS